MAAEQWREFEVRHYSTAADEESSSRRREELEMYSIGRNARIMCLEMPDEEWESYVLLGESPVIWHPERVLGWLTSAGIDPEDSVWFLPLSVRWRMAP